MSENKPAKPIQQTEDLAIYNLAFEIANLISIEVINWDNFSKTTLGRQLTRSADSIAQNIAEGFGRFHYSENRLFCYYARGSLFETKCSLNMAKSRSLMKEEFFQLIEQKINKLLPKLNRYIQRTGEKIKIEMQSQK